MKRTLIILATILSLCACEKTAQVVETNIELDTNEITLHCNEDKIIHIIGATEYCNAICNDEFVAWTYTDKNAITIDARHVGTTTISVEYKGDKTSAECKVTVLPSVDYTCDVTAIWGATKKEISAKVDKSYTSAYTDTQRQCETYQYTTNSGYGVTVRYYFKENELCGIHKVVNPNKDSESVAYMNIATGLSEYMERVSSNTPRTFSHPSGYYAALYTPSLNKNFDIYYAPTLDEALAHSFTK